MKHFRLTLLALIFTIPSFGIVITGDSVVCAGNSITLTATGGITTLGTWTSSNPAVAIVTGTPGIATVTGVSAGMVTITFTSGTTVVTKPVTVDPAVAAITGPTALCAGTTITLMDATPGGVWSSATTSVATVGSVSGVVISVASGTSAISYTVSPGCKAGVTVTVESTPAITGPTEICAGSTSTLSNALAGGTWASSTPSVATIGSSSGIVSGVSVGTSTITYTVSTGCTALLVITVVATPAPITGASAVCQGSTITLADAGGGTWTSSNPAVATAGSSGIITGVAGGTVNITYSLGTGCSVTKPVTVNPMPVCAVTGGGSYCSGDSGVHIGLACSGAGLVYQVYRGTSAIGGPLIGTGSALDFGLFSLGGIFTIVAMDPASLCTAIMTDSAVIIVNPTPAPVTGNSEVCIGYTITLADTSSGGMWSSSAPAKAMVGSASGMVTGVSGGTTTISYSIPGTGCFALKTVTVGSLPCSTGITLVANNTEEVTIYPNPANDELTILLNNVSYNSYTINNQLGQVSGEGPISTVQSKIDIHSLPQGMYMIILKGDDGNKVMKFVKM